MITFFGRRVKIDRSHMHAHNDVMGKVHEALRLLESRSNSATRGVIPSCG
jgi:hypothetical protein